MGSMSETRKRYFVRLVGRVVIFITCFIACIIWPNKFEILEGNNFFDSFSTGII